MNARNIFLILVLIASISCRASKPKVDNVGMVDTLFVKSDVSNTIPNNQDNPLHTINNVPQESPKTSLFRKIFPQASTKAKTKFKNVTIIHQTAGGNIEAVTTAAPKKTIAKDKSKEKVKGQNAIKGTGNTATAAKSDKSLMWIIIALIVAVAGYLYFNGKKLI